MKNIKARETELAYKSEVKFQGIVDGTLKYPNFLV